MPDFKLRELPVLALDCQSTGASPRHGSLLEIGWAHTRADRGQPGPRTHLVRLPDGAELPRRIAQLTGITAAELGAAIEPADAWRKLCAAAADIAPSNDAPPLAVIHFARFERPFLRALHEQTQPELSFPLDIVCTHEIAARLFPALPRRGLRALAGYLGFSLPMLRRCSEHVAATAFVWTELVARLDSHGITGLEALRDWLAAPAPRRPRKGKCYPMARGRRLAVPDQPGVYRMLRDNGDILYIGKATSLKRRVNSYFQKQSSIPDRTLEMLTQARDLDVTVTASALEAALLESDEIKRWAPPYNVALLEAGRPVSFIGRAGPFRHADDVRALRLIAGCAAAGSSAPLDGLFTLEQGPDGDCLERGFELFRSERGLDAHTTQRQLCRLAAQLWRDRLRAEDAQVGRRGDEDPDALSSDEDSDAPASAVGPELPWTPERVAHALASTLRRAGHALRRGAWLRRLGNCTVAWTEPGWPRSRVRCLWVRSGAVVRGEWLNGCVAPPNPEPAHRRIAAHAFDVATYDRVRVLSTELRRLTDQGARVQLRFAQGSALADDRLRTALRWV